ncbi:hypothetical protein OIE68_00415 [Nocardia vinacea]|uniref:hypothetical protein n=1 Tax=Nocardia vinacea TaxID=96468 RepID=UPI002E13C85D|nr:hypothetical protein OIE68_00415 [Nocardia vinacea]
MSTASLSVVADTSTEPEQSGTSPTPDTVDIDGTTDVERDDTAIDSEPIVPPPPQAEAAYMDPNELLIDENVRTSIDLDAYAKEKASISMFGVRAPALAEREPDGSVHVYDGQLRVLLAREVGLAMVPVWITDADPTVGDNERRIARTIDQININDRRIPLLDADRASGVALTLELGASATRVAEGLQRKRSEITKTAAIGASPTAKRLLTEGRQLDFDQLAIIADYERRGDTDAVGRLERAGRYDFTYVHKRIDNERAATRALLEAALPYAAYGFGILTTEPDTDAGFVPAATLTTSDGDPVTAEDIYADPQQWVVWLAVEKNALLVDTQTGELVDTETVDWNTRTNPDAEPGEGLRHAESVQRADRWTPTYYLPEDALAGSRFQVVVPESDPQIEADTAAEREQARLARRRVIKLNERGEAANERRNKFLPRLVAGATLHRATATFVAEALAHKLSHTERTKVAALLRIDDSIEALVTAISSASPNRAWTIVLAMQLASAELEIGKSLWRDALPATQRYLRFLDEATADPDLDFALVDVEQAAAKLIDYHDIDIES